MIAAYWSGRRHGRETVIDDLREWLEHQGRIADHEPDAEVVQIDELRAARDARARRAAQ